MVEHSIQVVTAITAVRQSSVRLRNRGSSLILGIAKGAGTSLEDVRSFISQFSKMEKMFTRFRKDRGFRKKLEKMMKGGGGMNLLGMMG